VETPFVPGIELCGAFFTELVRPLVGRAYPSLDYAATLIGPGSEVLGFDTARSTDHDWGPRLQLFLPPDTYARLGRAVHDLLLRELPPTFAGYPVHFPYAGAVPPPHAGPDTPPEGVGGHRVVVTEPTLWYAHWLGFQPQHGIGLLDWLATPTQSLLEQSAGAVYHDSPGTVTAARAALMWYPTDVWRYLLAAQWQRIAEEEPIVGRCTEVGDELGATVVTARLVRDLSRLRLLLARRYPPYSKWLGSALARLSGVTDPLLTALHSAGTAREDALCTAYEQAAAAQNELGLAAAVAPTTRLFHDRPFRVLGAERFARALRAAITDARIAALPPIGAIDQFADNTDLLGERDRRRAAAAATLNP
jgi:Domain of unknown function (DUF4037)